MHTHNNHSSAVQLHSIIKAAFAGIGLAGLFLVASTASAQSDALEEIVVTAQKRSQNLQDVPITINAFSAESLKMQNIENTSRLLQFL